MNEREIFIAALEYADPAARGAYLDQACGGDARLPEQIESLLAAHAKSGEFVLDAPALGETVELNPAVGERAGDTVGPYKLLQPLGEGGFGRIHMAEQQRPLRPVVALKIIETLVGLVRREARQASDGHDQSTAGPGALTHVHTPFERTATRYVASHRPFELWVKDRLAYDADSGSGYWQFDAARLPVYLRAGRNEILVKTHTAGDLTVRFGDHPLERAFEAARFGECAEAAALMAEALGQTTEDAEYPRRSQAGFLLAAGDVDGYGRLAAELLDRYRVSEGNHLADVRPGVETALSFPHVPPHLHPVADPRRERQAFQSIIAERETQKAQRRQMFTRRARFRIE